MVSTALVGTERLEPAPPESGIVADLCRQIGVSDRERALLGYAAVAAIARLAGKRLAALRAKEEELSTGVGTAPETLARCGRQSAGILSSLLNGRENDLVTEWLEVASAKGRLAPAELLPALLEIGRKQTALRAAIAACSGNRGLWLARQNPDWSYLTAMGAIPDVLEPDAASERWQTGTVEERRAMIERLAQGRRDLARELIQSTWQTDPAEQRARFLRELQSGLSSDDEPLLEQALDDRNKEVRKAASDLLRIMPDSRLNRRMEERARPLLTLKRSFLGGESLEISLPGSCDAAMIRDGIEAKARQGVGERAWWLRQSLAGVRPSYWTETLGRRPEQLIQAALKNYEWKDTVLGAWAEAAATHRDPGWQEALAKLILEDPKLVQSDGRTAFAPSASALSDERLEAVLLGALNRPSGENLGLVVDLLESREGGWSPTLARKLVTVAFGLLRGQDRYSPARWAAARILELAARQCGPSLVEEFESLWERAPNSGDHPGEREADAFLTNLRLRWRLRTSFEREDA